MLEDILKDSWAFQEIMQKGHDQGLKEGREEALRQEIQRHQQLLVAIVESRFPSLAQIAAEQSQALDNPERLQALILHVGLAQNEEKARKYLFEIGRQDA